MDHCSKEDDAMLTYDFSPLYRTAVGFDRLARLVDSALDHESSMTGYPPYNIEQAGDKKYRITLAVAGFSEDDLTIETKENKLTVTGKKTEEKGDEGEGYLYKGIAERDFVHSFQLADYVKVTGANLDNGLLTIDLEREVPEEMKPRSIEIKSGAPESLVEKAKKIIGGKASKKEAA